LPRNIEPDAKHPKYILTGTGVGYRPEVGQPTGGFRRLTDLLMLFLVGGAFAATVAFIYACDSLLAQEPSAKDVV
jgi:hypothetical protein